MMRASDHIYRRLRLCFASRTVSRGRSGPLAETPFASTVPQVHGFARPQRFVVGSLDVRVDPDRPVYATARVPLLSPMSADHPPACVVTAGCLVLRPPLVTLQAPK